MISLMLSSILLALKVSTDLFSLVGEKPDYPQSLNEIVRVDGAPEEYWPCRGGEVEKDLLDYLGARGHGLLSEKDKELLEKGETNKIIRAALRKDYTSGGIFSKAQDPYYFLNNYLMESAGERRGLKSTLAIGTTTNVAALVAMARKDPNIYLSGVPFHTYIATENTKREVNILSAISIAAVLLIGFWLFRSWHFIIPTTLTLAAGFAAGTVALFAIFEAPHILTFLFGTSLIGLGVDYCYHGFSRNLLKAWLTTLLAFTPLLFSSVTFLNQMAVFTMVGLTAILGVVWLRK